jgi:hypothetical protein
MKPPPKSWHDDEYALAMTEVGLNIGNYAKNNNSLWLVGSDESCHMMNDIEGMFDFCKIKVPIKIGSGQSMLSTHVGSKRMKIISKAGYTAKVVFHDVKYFPNLWINLSSVTTTME